MATLVQGFFSGLCQLCHGSSSGELLFQSWVSHQFPYVGICYSVCFLLSGSSVAAMFMGSQPHGFTPPQPFWVYPSQVYVPPSDALWPMPEVMWVTAPSALSRRESHATHWGVFWPSNKFGGTYIFGDSAESHQSLCLPCKVGKGLLFHGLFQLMTKSTPHLWWVRNLVILVWLLYKIFGAFTHTWLPEHFVALSYISPGFMGKVSTLIHFLLEWGWENHSYFEPRRRLSAWFWFHLHWLYSDHNWIHHFMSLKPLLPSVSSEFLHSIITMSSNSILQLAPSIKSKTLWCQAVALLLTVPLVAKCQLLNWFLIF